MTTPLSLAIAGAAGRMGRQLIDSALTRGHAIVGATERADHPDAACDLGVLAGHAAIGRVAQTDVRAAAADAGVWIDFTTPDVTLSALKAFTGTSVKAVIIGTTGFTPDQAAEIEQHASTVAIVKAGNFSLGVAVLSALVRQAASALGEEWDIDIFEAHHRHKVDAPSGTALMLAAAAADGRGAPLSDVQHAPYDGPDAKRAPGQIGFASSRTGGIIGEHEVRIGSETELISLKHTALDRRVFAEGAIRAAEWAVAQPPGLYGIHDVLGM
ncbi:MAG: 4-hydroxy-tetrahydrodipicolinate reductase [Pseudomonadota bacterium]